MVLQEGARGFLVRDVQERLALPPDAIFGTATIAAIRKHQEACDLAVDGVVGPQTLASLRLPRFTPFLLCMNLVSALEGTGFGDANNRDIDGAGVTLGIAGFTTAHGEVQQLVRNLVQVRPDALDAAGPVAASHLRACLQSPAPATWNAHFYENQSLRPAIKHILRLWAAGFSEFRQLQLAMAHQRFWLPAQRTAQRLQRKTLRTIGFLLDVGVQNGGWRRCHDERLKAQLAETRQPLDEPQWLAAAARAVAHCARPRWCEDVLAWKLLFAQGEGRVHGARFCLKAQGL